MANVPAKSIKFPGLDDTYTFLQNDPTLSVSGKAADAKVTGDKIDEVISDINNIDGVEVATLSPGYINTSGATVDITAIVPSPSGYTFKHAVMNCSEGDVFTITGSGGIAPRLWCFIDSSGNSLSAAASVVSLTRGEIIAPTNAAKAVFNFYMSNHGTFAVKGLINPRRFVETQSQEISSSLASDGKYTIKASDLELGSWGYSTKVASTTRARTKYLIPVSAGSIFSYTNTTFDILYGILPTPTSTSYIQGGNWLTGSGSEFPITTDGWLTFVIRNHNDINANVDPADFDGIVTIETRLGIFKKAHRQVPNVDLLIPSNRYNITNRGVTFTWSADKSACTVDGTNDGTGTAGIYFLGGTTVMPNGIQAGKKYHVKYKTTDNNVKLGIYYYTGEGTYASIFLFTEDGILNVPADATGLYFFIYVASGVSVSNVVVSDMALYEVEAADVSEVANLQSQIDEIWAYLRNQ